jgi:1-acyl-sn-glycerol-3-phosphate acyltransferase
LLGCQDGGTQVGVRPVRPLQQKRGWAFNLAVPVLKPVLLATTRRTWIDGEKIPATGGCILVFNHVSHVDPLTAAHIVYDHGRKPRYLAKSGLFKNPALSHFLRAAGQIPVERQGRVRRGRRRRARGGVRGRVPRGHADP